jgi:mannosyl-oligosaccharide glucosidase
MNWKDSFFVYVYQFQGEHKESLYWGTYRPHVYFGVRARTPLSLVAGLMWLGVKDEMYVMRHFCENSDDLSTFGWREHNGRDYGRQELVENDMVIETSFVKSKGDGLGYGGDWAVRIDVKNKGLNDDVKRSAHLFFYLADEGGNVLNLGQDGLDFQGSSLLVSGSREDVGDWQIHLKSQNQLETHYSGFKTPHIYNLSDLVQQNLALQARKFGRLQLSDTSEDSSNIYIFQISGRLPFTIDIPFISGIKGESSNVEKRLTSLTGLPLSDLLKKKHQEFDAKFNECFKLSEKHDSETLGVGRTAIANMLGGIGYFYGQSKIYVPKSTQASLFPSSILCIIFSSYLCSSHLQTSLDLSQNHTIDTFYCSLEVGIISCCIGQPSCTQLFQADLFFLGGFCGTKVSINC